MLINDRDRKNWLISLVASLTLGLAPVFPEPHLWGKIKWIMGGAKGMQFMDYFDFLLHGLPWFFLLFFSIKIIFSRQK